MFCNVVADVLAELAYLIVLLVVASFLDAVVPLSSVEVVVKNVVVDNFPQRSLFWKNLM